MEREVYKIGERLPCDVNNVFICKKEDIVNSCDGCHYAYVNCGTHSNYCEDVILIKTPVNSNNAPMRHSSADVIKGLEARLKLKDDLIITLEERIAEEIAYSANLERGLKSFGKLSMRCGINAQA